MQADAYTRNPSFDQKVGKGDLARRDERARTKLPGQRSRLQKCGHSLTLVGSALRRCATPRTKNIGEGPGDGVGQRLERLT